MNDTRNDRSQKKQRFRRASASGIGTVRRTATQQAGRQGFSTANAQRTYDRYVELAKEALRSGDPIEAENCYQHAEHYYRMMRNPEQL